MLIPEYGKTTTYLITVEYKGLNGNRKHLAAHQRFTYINPIAFFKFQFIEGQQVGFHPGFATNDIAHTSCNVRFKDQDDR